MSLLFTSVIFTLAITHHLYKTVLISGFQCYMYVGFLEVR